MVVVRTFINSFDALFRNVLSVTRLVNTLRKSYCRPQYEILGRTMKKKTVEEKKNYYLQMATQSSSNVVVLEKDILLDYPSIIKRKKNTEWSHHKKRTEREWQKLPGKCWSSSRNHVTKPRPSECQFLIQLITRWHKHQKCYHFLVKYSGVVVTDELRIGKWNVGLALGCRSCAMRYAWQLCKS